MSFQLATSKDGKNIYSALSTDTKDIVGILVGDTCIELNTGHEFIFTSVYPYWFQMSDAGIPRNNNVGLQGIQHNRNIASAALIHPGDGSNNVATFTAAQKIKEVTIDSLAITGTAKQNDDVYLVVVNATTDAIAKTWLLDAGSKSQDVRYDLGHLGVPLTVRRKENILQIDVLPLTVAMRFILAGVGS